MSECFIEYRQTSPHVKQWTATHETQKMQSLIGYEPAGLTVHPPPPNDRGWVHFFRMGV